MAYLGNSPVLSQQEYRNIDNISGSFNGSTTSFALLVNGVAPVPAPQSSNQCLISVNGVVQKPDDTGATGFRISGGNIIFSSAPTGGQSFFGVILAGADYIYAGQNFPDGTVSAPSITFNQDLDTGFFRSGAGEIKYTANGTAVVTLSSNNLTAPSFIPTSSTAPTNGVYLPAANSVAISTGGSGRLFIDSSGNVLVNTSTSPTATIKLLVNGNAGVSSGSYLSFRGEFGNTTEPAAQAIKYDSGLTGLQYYGYGGHAYFAGGSERMRLDSSGRLGVGTSSPSEALTVSGKIQATTEFKSETGNDLRLNAGSANRDIFMQVNGSTLMTVQGSTGRVGIGTSSPNMKFTLQDGTFLVRSEVTTGTSNSNHIGFSATSAGGIAATISSYRENANEASALTFNTWNGSAFGERMRVSASGLVGIGSTNGTAGLTVLTYGSQLGYSGNTYMFPSGRHHIQFGNVTNGTDVYAGFTGEYGNSSGSCNIVLQPTFNNVNQQAGAYVAGEATGVAATAITFGHFNAASTVGGNATKQERARIDSSGRLLVGTSTSRGAWFNTTGEDPQVQIEGTTYRSSALALTCNGGAVSGQAPQIWFGRSSGTTAGSNSLVSNNDILGRIRFFGADGSEQVETALIACEVDGTPGANDMPGRLTFSTTADGASSPTERFRISSDGSFSSVIPGGSTLYPEFGCRAWVNFSGATPAIRASGNISSVTKNGAGQWTINFSTAMPDTNYTTAFGGGSQTASTSYYAMEQHDSPVRTTSAVKIYALNASGTPFDAGIVCAHIFR